MATASLNIRLNYSQILELARQLSDEDKLMLNRELTAEVRRIKLQNILKTFYITWMKKSTQRQGTGCSPYGNSGDCAPADQRP